MLQASQGSDAYGFYLRLIMKIINLQYSESVHNAPNKMSTCYKLRAWINPNFIFPRSGIEFDAIDELGRSVDELKLPPPQPTSKEYGAYLRRLPSQQSEQYYGGGTTIIVY